MTDRLRADGGNIGYAVRPETRGRGYGRMMLRAALEECAKLGIDKALVTIHEAQYGIRKDCACQRRHNGKARKRESVHMDGLP